MQVQLVVAQLKNVWADQAGYEVNYGIQTDQAHIRPTRQATKLNRNSMMGSDIAKYQFSIPCSQVVVLCPIMATWN
jgi:hypothetical protein